MSETTTGPHPQAPLGEELPIHPSDILLNLIVTLLAPMFLCASGGDILFARMAALETVNSYCGRTHADLLLIARIIGFGLAALGSLSLSMVDDLSLAMTIRLRGNANACNRSSEQSRRALNESRPNTGTPNTNTNTDTNTDTGIPTEADPSEPDLDEAAVVASVATTLKLAAETCDSIQAARPAAAQTPIPPPIATRIPTERQRRALWGAGAARLAAEYTASLPDLPPAERRAATIAADALNRCANDLLSGNAPPRPRPGDLAAMIPPNRI
jgi:hypothetical protein